MKDKIKLAVGDKDWRQVREQNIGILHDNNKVGKLLWKL